MKQYCLSLPLDINATFENYYCQSPYVDALVTQIQTTSKNLIITGASGSGKTHLLHACCHYAKQKWLYLDCKKLSTVPTALLENLNRQLVCLDNIEYLYQKSNWEHRLFQLLLQDNNQLRLATGSNKVQTKRADLQSRLQSLLAVKIPELDTEGQAHALHTRASRKGVTLSRQLITWLQTHLARDNQTLFCSTDLLIDTCIKTQKKPTISLAKSLFEENAHTR